MRLKTKKLKIGGAELHMYDLKGKQYSFCGPGTDLNKRLNPDDTPKDLYKPINKVDSICQRHDIAYREADKGTGTRHEADKVMIDELSALKNKELNWNEFLAKYFTKAVIGIKHKLGLGFQDDGTILAKELHKPVNRKFKRRRVMVFHIDDIWSADLTNSFQSLAKNNYGYKYMLNVIDLFSKQAYALPLKTKTADEVMEAFDRLFKYSGRIPKKLWTDQGIEFTNNKFKKFLADHNIGLYHVYNEGKACVIERFNRTLGEMIQNHLTAKKTDNYIDILQDLLDKYNHRTHSTIKMTPFEASKLENEAKVQQIFRSKNKHTKKEKSTLKIGDRVRLTVLKNRFEKGYKPNWTEEIFAISNIIKSNPFSYKVKDLKDEPILGSFYKEELQKSNL